MTEQDQRIPLTSSEMYVSVLPNFPNWYKIKIKPIKKEDAEKLKQQILSDAEKAKELDEIRKTGLIFTDRDWVKDQIKQLKEKAEKWDYYKQGGNHNCGTYGCPVCDTKKLEEENTRRS
jgi:hypothetical protein